MTVTAYGRSLSSLSDEAFADLDRSLTGIMLPPEQEDALREERGRRKARAPVQPTMADFIKGAASHFARSGHGHVFPRADGVRARCGGPIMCGACAAEKVVKDAWDNRPSPTSP